MHPEISPARRPAELRRTWLFGPGADARAHEAMRASGADARFRGSAAGHRDRAGLRGGPRTRRERALVDGLWAEVPTWRNGPLLLDRGRALGVGQGADTP